MLTSDTAEASQPQPASPLIGRLCRINTIAGEPEQQPGPLHRSDAFTEPVIGDGRGQNRLQAENQGGQTCGNRMRNRDRSAAEIEPVHQNTRHRAMGDADAIGPSRPRDHDNYRHQGDHQRHPDREIGQGVGIVHDVFRGDEAGAPQHDENRRRRARGKLFKITIHLRKRSARSYAMRQGLIGRVLRAPMT